MFKTHPLLRALLIFVACWVIGLAVLTILYFAWLREWQMNWGATADEVSRPMAGDELLEDPELNATRVVEIKAPPEDVWPWVVQMGYKRGGFYNFDKLDNDGLPSAERILPEYQNLAVGDSIHFIIAVAAMEPNKSMLWVFSEGSPWAGATWSWGFYGTENGHTRLVSRLRQKYTFNTLQGIISWTLTDVTEIAMMRTCLLGIKHRVEGG
jgi:hypothetical protein